MITVPVAEVDRTGVFAKMVEVMKKVAYIQRDAKNVQSNYTYASERAIKEALHEALADVGLVFQLSTMNPRVIKVETVDNQGVVTWRNVTWIDVVYRFIDAETGNYVEGTFLGSGSARDEKGHYAAVTGALKYILTSCFLIPTGDDAEAEDEPEPKPKARRTPRGTPPQTYQTGADPEPYSPVLPDEPPPYGEPAPPKAARGRTSSTPAQTRRSEPAPSGAAPRPPSDAQNKFVAVLVKKKLEFADDREAVHEWMTGVLGKEITSQKNLTSFDAHKLIEKLQGMSDVGEENDDDLPF